MRMVETTTYHTKFRSPMEGLTIGKMWHLALTIIIKIDIVLLGTTVDGQNAGTNQMNIDLSKTFEWNKYFTNAGARDPDVESIERLHHEARAFLEYYEWCKRITEEYVGFIYPGIVGVFLFRFIPSREGVDEWVWVIVGDLPPAYITCEDSPNPATALDGYIGAMQEWVEAAERGTATDHLIPVNVDPTPENAARLKVRLEFLDEKILSGYGEDLKAH